MTDIDTSYLGPILADLLMGAAYADDHFDGREGEVVREKLAAWLDVDELPNTIESRLDSFDHTTFDLSVTVSLLGIDDAKTARKVLELVAAVHDADDVTDLDEDAYLKELASALGVPEEDYADLQLEVLSVEDLREGIRGLAAKPPPIPKDS